MIGTLVDELPGAGDSLGESAVRSLEPACSSRREPAWQAGGVAQDEVAVHEHERLGWRRAGDAAVAVDRHDRRVERRQKRDRLGPQDLQIEAPPARVIGRIDQSDGVLDHGHGRAEQGAIKPPADLQDAVAKSLRLEPAQRESGRKARSRSRPPPWPDLAATIGDRRWRS